MTKTDYFKFGGIGFLIGLIPSIMSAVDAGTLNKILGWFYNSPYFIMSALSSCSGEECIGYVFITWIFWPILGIFIGILIARKNQF